jgi:O-antigen/teichoic acid export membrane protein
MELPPDLSSSTRSRMVRGLTRGGTQWLLVGSLLGGLGAYLFQVVGTRALGEEAFAPISTLWTVQYLSWSIFLYAVETYVAREVLLGRIGPTFPRKVVIRTWAWIASVAVAVGGASWLFRGRLFYGLGELAVVAGLVVLSFGAFAFVRGRLAGAGRYRSYGLASATESLVRLALAISAVLAAATTRALAWTLPIGAIAAACLWFLLGRRTSDRILCSDEPAGPPRTSRFLVLTIITNAAVQLLLAGGPLALVVLSAGSAEVSVFFVTITAARVPVVIALGGVLSRVLSTFTRVLTERGHEALQRLTARLAAATMLVAVAGAALGAMVGAPLVGAFFGTGFTPPWWLACAAGGGVILATGGMLLNQLLVAGRLEHRLPLPWFVGLVAGVAVMMKAAGSPTERVTAGFVAGEIVALIALTIAGSVPRRSSIEGGSHRLLEGPGEGG